MEVEEFLVGNANYDHKITSERLISDNFQVKFFARLRQKKNFYGYILVDAACSLKEVILKISNNLFLIQSQKDFRQRHLYSIGKFSELDFNFIIFNF